MKDTSWLKLFIALVLGLALGYWLGSAKNIPETEDSAQKMAQAKTIDLQFVNHIQANFPEQDVFIVSKDDSNKVVRVEGDMAKDSAVLSQDAYASADIVEHDPFKLGLNPLGPFSKGQKLGFTLQQWLDASGKGKYTVEVDKAMIDVTFEKLVPSGVYTVWCSRINLPPEPKVTDKPCGAADGSENTMKADASGVAAFKLSFDPLEESTATEVAVIALAYHSDGKTYGANPGDFGKASHVHIFTMLPAPEAMTQ